MEFLEELLVSAIQKGKVRIGLRARMRKVERLVEKESVQALYRIKKMIEDDFLSDVECFEKIEEIVNIFEELGMTCGSRHDFG